jgi:hypothetical protein
LVSLSVSGMSQIFKSCPSFFFRLQMVNEFRRQYYNPFYRVSRQTHSYSSPLKLYFVALIA